MFLNLFIMAAIISVPPVLPLKARLSPTPLPQNTAPKIAVMNDWSDNIFTSLRFSVEKETIVVSVSMANIVFMQKRHPNIQRAKSINIVFIIKYDTCTGIPVPQNIIEDTPGMPPVVMLLGNKKIVQPIQYSIIPKAIMT